MTRSLLHFEILEKDVDAFEMRNSKKRFVGLETRRGRVIMMNKMPQNMLADD